MKKIFIFFVVFICAVTFFSANVEAADTCYSVDITIPGVEHWPDDGYIKVRCKNGHDAHFSNPTCPGEEKSVVPGEPVTLHNCDCKFEQNCFVITGQSPSVANLCTNISVSFVDGRTAANVCKNRNGERTGEAEINVTCQAPPGEVPATSVPEQPTTPVLASLVPEQPTAAPVAVCGQQCTRNEQCANAINGCTECGANNTCQVPTSPSSPNVCECSFPQNCTTSAGEEGVEWCSGAFNSDRVCVFSNSCTPNCGVCIAKRNLSSESPPPGIGAPPPGAPPGAPPEEVPSESPPENNETPPPGAELTPPVNELTPPPPGFETPTPGVGTPPFSRSTPTPGPGTPPFTSGTPGPGTGTPPPGKGTPTPTPRLLSAACHCAGIESTGIFAGKTTTFTGKSKADSGATITTMTFFVAKDNTKIAQSPAIVPTKSGDDFVAKWDFKFPDDVDPKSIYRVWVQFNCGTESAMGDMPNANVLGTETQNTGGFFAGIIRFFAQIFGINLNQTTTSAPFQDVTPTVTGAPKSLQLEEIAPAQITVRSCRFIQFKFPSVSKKK